MKVYRVSTNNKRKASYQELEFDVIHKCNFPKKVSSGNSQRFVFVLPKFSLGDSEGVEFELLENNGCRKFILK
ncbi:DUF4138 domain-containing protein [Aestuariibaculum sediminum]|uniref:DUF4138 domain-containing protein n=1 Tax=Aestuariibaculum sediminum TaxID=2770637 RepID=A0A8J6QAP5_9FLAO|nr:DUF4138 domain-containing protein [Aestuariibaculum sediminum]